MKLQKTKKHLTNEKKNGIIKKSVRHCKRHFADEYTEKYSRGRRGAPAKGVGRATGARVQISPSPPTESVPHFGGRFLLADQSALNSPSLRRGAVQTLLARHPRKPFFIRGSGETTRVAPSRIRSGRRVKSLLLRHERNLIW